jgi:hypothetical protein
MGNTLIPDAIELPAKILNACNFFQARSDVRWYLCGVHIDPAGYMFATNGHILIRFNFDRAKEIGKHIIVSFRGTIPKRAETAILLFASPESGIIKFKDRLGMPVITQGHDAVATFEIIDGKIVDVEKVIPKEKPIKVERIGISPDYVAIVGKASKALGSRYVGAEFIFRGENKPIEVFIPYPEGKAHVIIMPIRL